MVTVITVLVVDRGCIDHVDDYRVMPIMITIVIMIIAVMVIMIN